MSISVGAAASALGYCSGSISVSDTSAMPVGLRSRVPAKITSSMRDPRSVLADCSPSTQEMASAIFDLPHPLGPMMAAMPSPWNLRSVRSQNDLNPRICSRFSLSNVNSLKKQWPVASCQRPVASYAAPRTVYQTDTLVLGKSRVRFNSVPGWEGGHKFKQL